MRAERTRHQFVIDLGHGIEGARKKAAIESAARQAGLTPSAWARRLLYEASGLVHDADDWVTHGELAVLERRVQALEERKPLQTVMVDGRLVTRSPECAGCIFPHALCGPCSRYNGQSR